MKSDADRERGAKAASGPRGSVDVRLTDPLPRKFGRYQLFDRIGQGGMATIYLARMQTGLGADRLIVVKQIHRELASDPVFAAQFVEEAKLCAGLRHANIAQVLDLGRGDDDVLFMAMEYVEGLDLQDFLRRLSRRRIPLPPEFAFHVVREALMALDFAHRATDAGGRPLGIVHRDVSPSNVLLSLEGEVKLCDFGIAKALGRAAETPSGAGDAKDSRTPSGIEARVVGKSAYMAPEHARGEPIDARADLFAAGILLWELCAGRRLYRGSEAEMLEMARRAEIPPLPARGLPGHEELQSLLDRALAREPAARFPSAKAMSNALDEYLAKHRLLPSQLRFAAFLGDQFGEEIVRERREREAAARHLDAMDAPDASGQPLAGASAGERRDPESEPRRTAENQEFAHAPTVLRSVSTVAADRAVAVNEPSARGSDRRDDAESMNTLPPNAVPLTFVRLGLIASILSVAAALAGAGLYYLLTR